MVKIAGSESLDHDRRPSPQSPACDRCSQGVMDAENPHVWGECDCECHDPSEQVEPAYEHMALPKLARTIHRLEADRD